MSDRAAPFFVVGCPRSGTTMFRLMLNAHSRVGVPPESFFLPLLLDACPSGRPLTPAEVGHAHHLVTTHERWVGFGVEAAVLRVALEQRAPVTLGGVVDVIFSLAVTPKPRWGDKTPEYVGEIPRLARLLPDARFIHVIRDCRDVCRSLHDAGWQGKNWNRLAAYWRDTVGQGVETGRALGPRRYREVRYEDLVLDTRATLAAVMAFLDESLEPAQLRFHERAASQLPDRERRFHAKTSRPPLASDVGRWRRDLRGPQVAAIEFVAGDVMAAVGQRRGYAGVRRLFTGPAWLAAEAADWSRPARRLVGLHLPEIPREERS